MKFIFDIVEAFKIALSAIVANKARGILTTLGIIIGIVAVTTTMTAFNGMQSSFRQAASAVGADVIYVTRMPWIMMNDWFLYRNRPIINIDDADDLREAFAGRAVVNPIVDTNRDLKYRSTTMRNIAVIGTTDKMAVMSDRLPEDGRFLMPFDVTYKKNVVILGKDVADGLFPASSPINKVVNIGRYKFRVAGVMEKVGGNTFGGPDLDRQVFIPISTFLKNFGGRRSENVDIAVKSTSGASLSDLEYAVIGEMRKLRKLRPSEEDNFSINKLDSLMGAFNSVVGVVLIIGLLVTSISLFVGGIGVMNIMFVSVTERTREIGIRKAIGARRRSILLQFLLESAVICLIGGLIGIGLAALVAMGINASGIIPASISPGIMISSVVIAMLVGIVAGLVPAMKGARLDPIEALRYE